MRLLSEELKKIFRLFLADPKSLAAGVIAPTMILIVFSLFFGNISPFPIAVIDCDKGSYGEILKQEILAQNSPLGNKPYFRQADFTESVRTQAYPVPLI